MGTIYDGYDPRLLANRHHLLPGKRNPRVGNYGINDRDNFPFPCNVVGCCQLLNVLIEILNDFRACCWELKVECRHSGVGWEISEVLERLPQGSICRRR